MSVARQEREWYLEKVSRLRENVERAIRGKGEVVETVVAALFARGHVLVEDVPGVGKTTLARALARSIGCKFYRIQFTSDMLPTDILGVSVYDRERGRFEFKPGPIFANIILADEINRTTPKTQSCLLEAMNEQQVSIEAETYRLESPFFVIATQNPHEFFGTYPLPESQLDRFLVRVRVGYPAPDVERRIFADQVAEEAIERLRPVLAIEDVLELQQMVDSVSCDDTILDYLMRIVAETRASPLLSLGVSTRGGLMLHRAARARALVKGRDFVVPDDVKEMALPVLAHRVIVGQRDAAAFDRSESERVLRDILDRIPVPI
ncbi:MAG: MoxR family ATPase [Deltaproteobacteria bacterium]|nr:MoxR family ATPase [Deltaproteobacteria bacterium]